MKFKNEPLFLIAALCIFFPIGLILLLRSEFSRKAKLIMSCCCSVIFISLLSLAFLYHQHKYDPNSFQVIATRTRLLVGQSGGLAVTNDDDYITDFSITSNSEALEVHDSVYTAKSAGECTLEVTFQGQTRTIDITVDDEIATDSPVYASPSGERYHSRKSHGGKYAVEMTEEEALQSQKTPCKICYKNNNDKQ